MKLIANVAAIAVLVKFIRLVLAAAVFLMSLIVAPALGQSEFREQQIRFPAGSTGSTVADTIRGRESVQYRLSARAGQFLTVSLLSSSTSIYFNVYAPGRGPGDAALATSESVSSLVPFLNRFEGELPSTGTYTISVHLVRAAARRGDRASFVLNISAEDRAVQLPGGAGDPDFEVDDDGPQFWRVTGLSAGDSLNVRAGAGTSYRVIDRLASGEVVRNRGCTVIASGARWCEINRTGTPNRRGWVSARYLTAARGGGNATQLPSGGATQLPGNAATQLPGDAVVPGTNFNATGNLRCVIAAAIRQCRFGVVRRGGGNATLTITMPNGQRRVIEFLAGRPESSNSSAGLFGEWQGSTVLVHIGTTETYHVEDAVLFGG